MRSEWISPVGVDEVGVNFPVLFLSGFPLFLFTSAFLGEALLVPICFSSLSFLFWGGGGDWVLSALFLKSKVLVFFRVWSFNMHAPYILSADDLGDFLEFCRRSFLANRSFSAKIGAFSGPTGAFSGPIRTNSSAPHSHGEEQKLPRKGPFWPNWRLLAGQARRLQGPIWISPIGFEMAPNPHFDRFWGRFSAMPLPKDPTVLKYYDIVNLLGIVNLLSHNDLPWGLPLRWHNFLGFAGISPLEGGLTPQ